MATVKLSCSDAELEDELIRFLQGMGLSVVLQQEPPSQKTGDVKCDVALMSGDEPLQSNAASK